MAEGGIERAGESPIERSGESPEIRLRRLRMRSERRGTKEMDLILGGFAAARLAHLSEAELVLYDAMLSENDQDLYDWVSGRHAPPGRYAALIAAIAATTGGLGGPGAASAT